MKVGILTFHNAYNYGAYLQACALCTRLNIEDDIDAEIIDYYMEKEVKKYDINTYKMSTIIHMIIKGTYGFHKKLCESFERAHNSGFMHKSKEHLVSDSLIDFQDFVKNRYDAIIAGSDEIWKIDTFRGFPNAYWLIGDLGCRKLSYAASSRVNLSEHLAKENQDLLKRTLKQYEFIGVRDDKTKNEIDDIVGENLSKLCCDPSFLYRFKISDADISELVNNKKFDKRRKSVFLMIDNDIVCKQICNALGGAYNLINVFTKHKGVINVPSLEPITWLNLLAKSDYVITSFFHATCYSILYNVPFLAIGTKGKQSKLSSLLCDEKINERYITADNINAELVRKMLNNKNTDYFEAFVENQRGSFDTFLEALIK